MSQFSPSPADLEKLPPRERGLAIALEIQWRHDPREWREQVDQIACPEARARAEDYLGTMIERLNRRRKNNR